MAEGLLKMRMLCVSVFKDVPIALATKLSAMWRRNKNMNDEMRNTLWSKRESRCMDAILCDQQDDYQAVCCMQLLKD